jgi:hypothetical protein
MAVTRPKQALNSAARKKKVYKPHDNPKISNRFQRGRKADKA